MPGLEIGREIFVGQQFVAEARKRREPLNFWISESSKANAEVDYLLPGKGAATPVAIRPGAAGTLKSLHLFLHRAGLNFAVRLHAGPLTDERHEVRMKEGKLAYRLLSLPLYLAEEVKALMPKAEGSRL